MRLWTLLLALASERFCICTAAELRQGLSRPLKRHVLFVFFPLPPPNTLFWEKCADSKGEGAVRACEQGAGPCGAEQGAVCAGQGAVCAERSRVRSVRSVSCGSTLAAESVDLASSAEQR